MQKPIMTTSTIEINIKKVEKSKLPQVDFNNLGFGKIFSDHMLECTFENGQWQTPQIKPFASIQLEPTAKIFHYGQSIFEGMKAYKDDNGGIWMFRPKDNHKRLNISAKRMAIPEIPEEIFIQGLTELLKLEADWIPQSEGSAMYIRPFIFASGSGLHASPADQFKFMICCAPSSAYFSGAIKVKIEEKYARAANGGVGYAKAGGNYAAQFYPTKLASEEGFQQVVWTDDHQHQYIEEAGAMNIFVRIGDELLTTPTSDRILDGITRKSVITLAKHIGIKTTERKISVTELVDAANNGTLKEMFGSGTAAVISPIDGFGYQGITYQLPNVENPYGEQLKKKITDIQYNRADDPFGWRYKVN